MSANRNDSQHAAPLTRRREPNANHPDAREPDDYSDLRVKALDHSAIWGRYNTKAGAIQKVVPAGEDE